MWKINCYNKGEFMDKYSSIIMKVLESLPLVFVSVIVFIVTTIFKFSTNSFIDTLGLTDLLDNFTLLIGILWVISISYLLALLLKTVYLNYIKSYFDKRKIDMFFYQNFKNLTIQEKRFIQVFFDEENNEFSSTAQFDFESSEIQGIASSLINKGLIYRPSQMSYDFLISYVMQPGALRVINKMYKNGTYSI
jgi:hypothetical protein